MGFWEDTERILKKARKDIEAHPQSKAIAHMRSDYKNHPQTKAAQHLWDDMMNSPEGRAWNHLGGMIKQHPQSKALKHLLDSIQGKVPFMPSKDKVPPPRPVTPPNLSPVDNIIGSGSISFSRLRMANLKVDFASTDADQLAFMERVGDLCLAQAPDEPRSFDDTGPRADWAGSVLDSVPLLVELKNMKSIVTYCRQLDRDDATPGSPLKLSTLESLLSSIKEVRVPPLAMAIAEIYTRAIQTWGSEPDTGYENGYFIPSFITKDHEDLEDQVDLVNSHSQAGLFANYMNAPLLKFPIRWVKTLHEVPYMSDFAQHIARALPIIKRTAGPAYTLYDTEYKTGEPTYAYWNQHVGMSVLHYASVFFRDTDNAGATKPAFVTSQEPAADDKLSILYAEVQDSAFTPVGLADFLSTWISKVQAAQGLTNSGTGMFCSVAPGFNRIAEDLSKDVWDRRAASWCVSRSWKYQFRTQSPLRVIPDIVPESGKANIPIKRLNSAKYGFWRRRSSA